MAEIIEIGELRKHLGRKLNKDLEKLINQLSHRRDLDVFYIRIHAGWSDRNVGERIIRTRFQILGYCPPPLINTILVKFTRRNGRVEILHALPADLSHRPPTALESDELVPDLVDAEGR